jgi:molybdopterin synthase catalytic subunit
MKECLIKLEENLDYKKLYDEFYESLSDSTGTILVHHGKAKFPGKYVANYSKIKLFKKNENAEAILEAKAQEIFKKYNLNKLLAVHSIGYINRNDSILFLAVEAKDRVTAFDSVRELLEFIKSETLLGLEEIG